MSGLLLALMLTVGADWAAVIPTVSSSVPKLVMSTRDGHDGSCSGVIVDRDADKHALVLTAAHCIEGNPDVTVNGRHADVVFSNRILDLALLTTKVKDEQAIELAPSSPSIGTDVAILGYSVSDEFAAQFGHVSLRSKRDASTLIVDGMILFGNSGGCAVDGQGRLVGVNSYVSYAGMLGQMAHVAGLVSVETVREFLDAYRESVKRRK